MIVNMLKIKVYVKLNENDEIIAVDSSVFLRDLSGWTEIDEGYGDRYAHAQGNYFPTPLLNMDGVYIYRRINGQNISKTPEELAAEALTSVSSMPTLEQQVWALTEAMLEMAGEIYG